MPQDTIAIDNTLIKLSALELDKLYLHAKEVTSKFIKLPVIADVLIRLRTELPQTLFYHCFDHTLDVINEAILFGVIEGLREADLKLLAVAAAFHDSAFIYGREDHELRSAQLAEESLLKDGGFSEKDISKIKLMILDTKLVTTQMGRLQVSTIPLSRYLLDADLSNLGRQDFFDKSELQAKELGLSIDDLIKDTLSLVENHEWQTKAAFQLRNHQKLNNIDKLKSDIKSERTTTTILKEQSVNGERLQFLARLPLLINNTLEASKVIKITFEHAIKLVAAETATIFISDSSSDELIFWVTKGEVRLDGKRMPSNKGIVGWVINHQQSIIVNDVSQDSRFFATVDHENSFRTNNLICVPLTVRGSVKLGALQIINKNNGQFTEEDLVFCEQFANQIALAIDNAQLYEQLSLKNRELEVLNRRKSEMLRVLAHEIKTPVSIITSAADILTQDSLSDSQSRERIYKSLIKGVDRMTKISQQLSSVAYLGQQVTVDKETFNLSNLLQKLYEQFIEISVLRNISLKINLQSNNCFVSADPALIHIAIYNLISNAIRFTPDGGVVELNLAISAGLAEIKIIDTGIGIEKNQQALIFNKFYEVANSMNHSSGDFGFQSGGLGLGLASVKAILEAHKSSVLVDSTVGKGSCFTVHLPLAL